MLFVHLAAGPLLLLEARRAQGPGLEVTMPPLLPVSSVAVGLKWQSLLSPPGATSTGLCWK